MTSFVLSSECAVERAGADVLSTGALCVFLERVVGNDESRGGGTARRKGGTKYFYFSRTAQVPASHPFVRFKHKGRKLPG